MARTHVRSTLRLRDDQRAELESRISRLSYPFDGPFAGYIGAARAAVASVLDEGQRRQLARLRSAGLQLVENLPVDPDVRSGPVNPEAAVRTKPTDISEGVLTGFVAQCGVPYAIRQEGRSLISNVAAKKGRTDSLTGVGAAQLDPHIENAFGRTFAQDRAPAGLALIGVCREPGASPPTVVADGRRALRRLAPECQAILRQPRFWIRRPERWRSGDIPGEGLTPVVTGPPHRPSFIIATYGDMMRADDAEAAQALEAFIRTLEAVAVHVVIEPGRLLLIDNHAVLHGRGSFPARFTPEGAPYRWLQRLFWTNSLDIFGSWRVDGDHMIDAAA